MNRSTDLESVLARFLPPPALTEACAMLRKYPHHLVVSPPRRTKLGDFTVRGRQDFEITVNGNLNPYAFLVTLMHELAHLITHIESGWRIKPHGEEWKNNFRKTLGPFLGKGIFPEPLEKAIYSYLANPAASTCNDYNLSKALAQYDRKRPNVVHLDEIPHGSRFIYGRERKEFEKGAKQRTRYLCREVNTKNEYLFNPLVKVLRVG
jgi:hypothetical protein